MTRSTVAALTLALFGALVLGGCGSKASLGSPTQRTLYMTALEYKGGTDKEPFPAGAPLAGKGYVLTPPNKDGRWETSTYRWEPGMIVVNQGDEVELRIWGVNGGEHHSSIENYAPSFLVKRGQLTTVKFKADKAGIFNVICGDHAPSMQGQLVVMPRS